MRWNYPPGNVGASYSHVMQQLYACAVKMSRGFSCLASCSDSWVQKGSAITKMHISSNQSTENQKRSRTVKLSTMKHLTTQLWYYKCEWLRWQYIEQHHKTDIKVVFMKGLAKWDVLLSGSTKIRSIRTSSILSTQTAHQSKRTNHTSTYLVELEPNAKNKAYCNQKYTVFHAFPSTSWTGK